MLVYPILSHKFYIFQIIILCWDIRYCHINFTFPKLSIYVGNSIPSHIFYIFESINLYWYIRYCHISFTFYELPIYVGTFDTATYILHFTNYQFLLVYSILPHIFYILHIINFCWYIRYCNIYFTFSKLSIYVGISDTATYIYILQMIKLCWYIRYCQIYFTFSVGIYSILPHIFYIFQSINLCLFIRYCHIYFTFSKLSIYVGIFDAVTYILHFPNYQFMLVYSMLLHIFYISQIINLCLYIRYCYMYIYWQIINLCWYIRYCHIYFTISKLSIYVGIFAAVRYILYFLNYQFMLVYSILSNIFVTFSKLSLYVHIPCIITKYHNHFVSNRIVFNNNYFVSNRIVSMVKRKNIFDCDVKQTKRKIHVTSIHFWRSQHRN